jgi:hypothetical protein
MRRHKSFEAALDQVRGPPPDPDPTGGRPPTVGISAPIPPLEQEARPDVGVAYLWDTAVAWIPEPEVPEPPPPEPEAPPAPPRPPPSANLDDVARELNLTEISTADELNRIRRRFMWENHPDRCPDLPEPLCNRRVAIANMLIDHALDKLARPKRAK